METIKAITGKRMTKRMQIQNAMAHFRQGLTYVSETRAVQVGTVEESGQRSLYVHQFEVKDLMIACDIAGCMATIHGELSRYERKRLPENASVGTWFRISVH